MHLGWTTSKSAGRSIVQRPPLIPSAWMLLSARRSKWNRHPSLTWERRAAKAQKSQTPLRAPCATTPQGTTTLTASAGQMKTKSNARNKKKLRGRSSQPCQPPHRGSPQRSPWRSSPLWNNNHWEWSPLEAICPEIAKGGR